MRVVPKSGPNLWATAILMIGFIATLAVPLGLASCGDTRPPVEGPGATNPNLASCATPNDGCPCDSPGLVVDCGNVKLRSGDYVSCSMGKRTCNGTSWGSCIGGQVTTNVFAGGGLHGSGLGGSSACTNNPCDPYCNNFVDDGLDGGIEAGSGFVINPDGGLSLGGGSSTPGTLTTSNGDTACPGGGTGGANAHSNPCNAAPYQNCQQDFHCDTVSNTCVWNSPSNYANPACATVDLTVGAACDDGTEQNLPVCNRGTTTIASGTVIGIHMLNPAQYVAWNTGACPVLAGAYNCTYALPAALVAGQCVDVRSGTAACPNWPPGSVYAVINAGAVKVAECAGACANNGAFVKSAGAPGCNSCGSGCTTTLNGTIKDPANIRPVYNVNVYVPTSTPTPFVPGVACDTCASLVTGGPSVLAITDSDGTFTLPGVPAGVPFPLVIQTGRWRRKVTVPAIPACTSALLSAAKAHLPSNHLKYNDQTTDTANPDIPLIAIGTGQGDATECLLQKMGLDTGTGTYGMAAVASHSEFTNPSGTGRIHMYKNNATFIDGATPSVTTLWDTPATLANYQALLMPCNNQTHYPQPPNPNYVTANEIGNVLNYTTNGGRLFGSHWGGYEWVFQASTATPSAYPTVTSTVNWTLGSDNDRPVGGANMLVGLVDQTSPKGIAMANWLFTTGGSTTLGQMNLPDYRHIVASTNAAAKRVIYSNSTPATAPNVGNPSNTPALAGPMVNVFSIDTPVGGSQCGKIVIPEMHVSGASSSGTAFPAECAAGLGMTSQELAFEFMLLDITSCVGAAIAPPPPPPATYTRDYQAVCPAGTRMEWEYFSWQGGFPAGTSINFTAQTADTQAGLTGPPVPPPVSAGNTGASTSTWTSDPNTVAWHLKNDVPAAPQISKAWLRVSMKFNPSGGASPSLTNWRQVYDCLPAE